MIQQAAIGLDSRSLAHPYLDNGMLPLITAPMSTVVDKDNYKVFLNNNINVCLPRGQELLNDSGKVWISVSLDQFIDKYANITKSVIKNIHVCIDTANGNMPKLHKAIRDAKDIYGNDLVIMAGNVASVPAFIELAKTGVDYIRVGIGGGGACTTTVHTGVGQVDLEQLIRDIKMTKKYMASPYRLTGQGIPPIKYSNREINNIKQVKIVADGISSYIKYKNLHRNGYAAINHLLVAGADLVMIGSIFNKAVESPGNLYYKADTYGNIYREIIPDTYNVNIDLQNVYKLYRGMSTREEQENYKKNNKRHSEGKSVYNLVEYTLQEWLEGAKGKKHDDFPGFINCLQSIMSYVGAKTLKEL